MKSVLITGAARGIGRAIALTLSAAGYDVFCVDVDGDALAAMSAPFGSKIHTWTADASNAIAVEQLFGALDASSLFGLVNCAGIHLGKHLQAISVDELDRVINVNLKSAAVMSQYFARAALSNRVDARIVNISSSSIYGGSDPIYSATKSGLIGLTKSCAMEFAPHIRVNAIAVGIVPTAMFASIPDEVIARY